MKVLFFLNSLSQGGAERVAVTLANYWANAGWSVTVVTIDGKSSDFYRLAPTVNRKCLNMAGKSSNALLALKCNIRRTHAIYKNLQQVCPDIAISFMPTANVTLGIAGRLAGIPCIGSERIYPPAIPLGILWAGARRFFYWMLSAVVAQTKESANWLLNHTASKRVEVIANPVQYPLSKHSPSIDPATICSNLSGDQVLLAVGRLTEQKCFDRLLKCFATLAQEYETWSLVILGDGDLHSELRDEVIRLNLVGRVALPGAVGNVADWFSIADGFVLSSKFEGFPNALLEAMACGVAAVSFDCMTGPSEIIEHDVNGVLVPDGDFDALSDALSRVMGNLSLRKELGRRAIEVRKTFAVKHIAHQWEELIYDVAHGGGR